jgi:hypothetical protein
VQRNPERTRAQEKPQKRSRTAGSTPVAVAVRVDAGKATEAGKIDSKQGEDSKPAQQKPAPPKKLAIVVRAGEREARIDHRGKVAVVFKDTGEVAEIDLEAVEIVGTEEIENEGAEATS